MPTERLKNSIWVQNRSLMTEFNIRRATVEDIPIIQSMADVVFRKTYANILSPEQMEYMMGWMYSTSSLQSQIEGEGNAFYIAFFAEVPAAYVSFEQNGSTYDGAKIFHLQKLYILPEYQHSGLGRQLFEFVKKFLSDHYSERCRIELNVNRSNPAVGFYEHIGLVRTGQGDFPIGKGFYMNDFIYSLDI